MEQQLADFIREMKEVRTEIGKTDAARVEVIEELKRAVGACPTKTDIEAKLDRIVADQTKSVEKYQTLEATIDELAKTLRRPGVGGSRSDVEEAERKSAIALLETKHALTVQKRDPDHPFAPNEDQIATAIEANRAMKSLIHSTNFSQLTEVERKSLSAFNVGSNGFILSPEMSSTVLSCLEDVSDITGLMNNVTIAGPSIRFLVDNVRLDTAAWACEASCFANNPQADLNTGLGELELKPETLRYIVCSTRDLLEDASINIESWMLGKVNWAFRNTMASAVITGDGDGRPRGILAPRSGITVCDTADASTDGQFTWQDLLMLKWQVPVQYHNGARYLMNQTTFGKALTISDANGRPIMIASPLDAGQLVLNGSPVSIVTQMPDVAPGATPVAFGNWRAAYMIVNRKAVTLQQDPYSASFCILFKFEARIGGGIICPNAARLLRIQ